jgi:hypothetical protein
MRERQEAPSLAGSGGGAVSRSRLLPLTIYKTPR